MSDEPESPTPDPKDSANPGKRPVRVYLDEERYVALAAVDLNGGNVYRTAVAIGIPARTLADWVEARARRIAENQERFTDGRKEKRGDLASKLEDKIHSVVESITPEVIGKASLAQRGVFIGIGVDKTRILRGQGLDPDPSAELCRLLGLNRQQLPERLVLEPDEEIPPGFAFLETQAIVRDAPQSTEPADPDDVHSSECAALGGGPPNVPQPKTDQAIDHTSPESQRRSLISANIAGNPTRKGDGRTTEEGSKLLADLGDNESSN